mgnify:CR=1 FL=1
MMKHYVIIGNGTAAVGCIEGIRTVDKESPITVVSGENRHVYCRPLISYYLEGMTDIEKMKYRKDSFYSDNNCEVLYGKHAVSVDKDKKTVQLDDGEVLNYDELCVAAGSRSFVPPFEGLDTVEKKFNFMTLDDALALESAVEPDSKVLIVGAGLIGLKCAEGIQERVGSITVCDLADRVLSSILDSECSELMSRNLEEHGISLMLGDTAVRFDKNTAYMKSGSEVDFDVLVLAVGVRANISLVRDAGGEVNRGIIINNRMQTTIDNIYAAGDCTEGKDSSDGQNRVIAILPNAYMQGKCAGVNMAGGDETFDNAIPMNSIGFFGMNAMTAGQRPDDAEVYEEKSDNRIKKLYTKDGYLTGFMMINCAERTGIYTSLIRNKTPLDSVDFDLLKKNPGLMTFGENYTGKKLGSVV